LDLLFLRADSLHAKLPLLSGLHRSTTTPGSLPLSHSTEAPCSHRTRDWYYPWESAGEILLSLHSTRTKFVYRTDLTRTSAKFPASPHRDTTTLLMQISRRLSTHQ